MTTIVIDRHYRKIVADRCYTRSTLKFRPSKILTGSSLFQEREEHFLGCSKLRRLTDGSVVVGAGVSMTFQKAYQALRKGKQPRIRDESSVYVISPTYPFTIRCYRKGIVVENCDYDWIAVGSGKEFAAAIMTIDTNNQNRAVRAVRMAAQYDPATSWDVDILQFPLYDDLD